MSVNASPHLAFTPQNKPQDLSISLSVVERQCCHQHIALLAGLCCPPNSQVCLMEDLHALCMTQLFDAQRCCCVGRRCTAPCLPCTAWEAGWCSANLCPYEYCCLPLASPSALSLPPRASCRPWPTLAKSPPPCKGVAMILCPNATCAPCSAWSVGVHGCTH